MSKGSPASLQTFIDTPTSVLEDRVQYSMVHILNVFYDGHLQIISFLYCDHQVHKRLFDHPVFTSPPLFFRFSVRKHRN